MYYYVEFLRGLRALRVIGIILGVLLVIAIALRLWAFSLHSPEELSRPILSSPTAHVTKETLADGTVRTLVNDPVKRVHAVIYQKNGVFQMRATVPISQAPKRHHITSGNYYVNQNQKTGMALIVANNDQNANIGIGILFAITAIIGLVTATCLAGALAKENDGHLELAWSKPVSRDRLAFASIGVDIAAVIASQIAALLIFLLIIVMFVRPHFYANGLTPAVIGCALFGPIAWYACLTAFSASLSRGLGMVIGLGWLAAIIIPGISGATEYAARFGAVWATIHAIFLGLAYIDPIAYMSFSTHNGLQFRTFAGSIQTSALALFLLAIGYIVLAVAQWRRVEA